MKKLVRALDLLLATLFVVAAVSAIATPAYGYADPGTGLLMIQIFTSMFAGALFMVRRRLHRLFEFLAGTGERHKRKS
jgi:hypothetical protein